VQDRRAYCLKAGRKGGIVMEQTNIMIVEDEGLIAYHLKEVLEKNRFSVPVTVASGEEAVQEAYNVNPDLVLMDINLAGEIDGIDAAIRIRDDFNIPIIFLTAYGDDHILQRAKAADPYGYILKPFNERELVIIVEVAVHKHKTEKNVKLKGILTVCAKCSKIRNENGAWEEMIEYILKHSDARFSHAICPDCAEYLYGGLFQR
jgi:CheY-like chemotaxis protein